MTNTLESIARGEIDAAVARSEIDRHIKATRDFAKLYSALLRWTWLALSERRADDDLRHWHRLILDVAAQAGQEDSAASENPDAEGPAAQFAERLRAMSDMIRVSIGMQSRPDKARLLTRAHVPAILQALNDRCDEAVARSELLQAVKLKTANLSRILTLLILEGLVERQADGRTAHFRITGEGIRHLGVYLARNRKQVEDRPVVAQKRQAMRVQTSEPAEPNPKLVEAVARILGDEGKAKQRRGSGGGAMRRYFVHPDPAEREGLASPLMPDPHHTPVPRVAAAQPKWITPSSKPLHVGDAVQVGGAQIGGSASGAVGRSQNDHRGMISEPFTAKSAGPEYKPFEAMRIGGAEKLADC